MGFLDSIRKMLNMKQSIFKIPLTKFIEEKVLLEQKEMETERLIEKLEQDKKGIFQKAIDDPIDRMKMVYASRIRDIESDIKNYDHQLRLLKKEKRVLKGLIRIKQNENLMKERGIAGLLSGMDMDELEVIIEDSTQNEEFYLDKFSDLIGALDRREAALQKTDEEDEAVLEIFDQIKAASEKKKGMHEEKIEVDKLRSQEQSPGEDKETLPEKPKRITE